MRAIFFSLSSVYLFFVRKWICLQKQQKKECKEKKKTLCMIVNR